MKTFFFAFSIFSLISCTSLNAQNLVGEWEYNAMQMNFAFQPVQQNGYGICQVTYNNDYQYQDYYWVQNQ